MNSVERVKKICKERKIPVSKLERDLGFSNGYIGQLRKGVLPDDRLKKISEYFGVSLDYLATGDDSVSKNDEVEASGERIKARRRELGISAEQLADILGISPATIYRYESNEISSIKVDKIKPIADALRVSPSYLTGWESADNRSASSSFTLSPDERALVLLFRELNDEGRDKARSYIDDLVASGRYIKTDSAGVLERDS